MSNEAVLIERRSAVALVTLNEPKTRNALSGPVIDALVGFLDSANADETLRCIVLTGAGEGFSSGGNIADMHKGAHEMFRGSPSEMQEGYRHHIQRIPLAFSRLDVPTIAAVNGAAIGAGFDLACMCDIRLASPEAKFAESFLRVGLVSGDGGAWFLPRVIGLSRAMEMALTCDVVDAARAEQWGLVSRVVQRESLIDEAVALAEKIAAFPPRSVRLNKRLMRISNEAGLVESLELASTYQAMVQHTADQREAVAAMIEKRKPTFTGR